MAKLLINDQSKVLVGSNGKAYAVGNMDALKGSSSPVNFNAASGKVLKLMRYGKCEQGGTPTPSVPVDIVCNNGVLRYGAVGKNLFDKNTADSRRISAYFSATGKTWSYANTGFSVRIPCLPNTTYTARYNGNSTQAVLSLGSTSSDNVPTSGVTCTVTQAIRQNSPTVNTPITLTTGETDKWLIVAYNYTEPQHTDMQNNLQVEKGSAATSYQPFVGGIYTDGTPEVLTVGQQTVNDVPMLLGVGDYADEAEIISGLKTGKVGIYVFTGEEAFTKGSAFYTTNTNFLPSKAGDITPICTHFKAISAYTTRVAGSLTMTVNGPYNRVYTGCVYFYADRSLYATAADFQAWLAAQYAAGTPVIVVYPLATETTEQVTPQPLNTGAGQNTLTDTAEVSNAEYNMIYKI